MRVSFGLETGWLWVVLYGCNWAWVQPGSAYFKLGYQFHGFNYAWVDAGSKWAGFPTDHSRFETGWDWVACGFTGGSAQVLTPLYWVTEIAPLQKGTVNFSVLLNSCMLYGPNLLFYSPLLHVVSRCNGIYFYSVDFSLVFVLCWY